MGKGNNKNGLTNTNVRINYSNTEKDSKGSASEELTGRNDPSSVLAQSSTRIPANIDIINEQIDRIDLRLFDDFLSGPLFQQRYYSFSKILK